MFGYGEHDCAGKNAGILAGRTGMIPGCTAKVEEAFRQMGYYETESRMKRSDGGEFPAGLQLRPVFDSRGETRHIIMVVRDMTGSTPAGSPLHAVRESPLFLPSGIFAAGNSRYNSAI
jgi:PAS domain S-box-containing protein